jgi:L-aminopeptidase/D-esterase-like protein
MNSLLKEIPISVIENIRIGHAQDYENATGCTVIMCDQGAPTGLDVRGGGPASRESQLLDPVAANNGIHGLLLSGGSAFGLDAAGGVMKYLEEKNVGFPVGMTVVPIVCASCLFDLQLVNHKVRPDAAMAYEACLDAENSRSDSGNIGAGTGATVGKFHGSDRMMKSGLGCYAVQIGDLKVGAIVAVNAVGDIYDVHTGKKLAGLLNREKTGFLDTEEEFYRSYASLQNLFTGNTTIGAVITNGKFDKIQMKKIASMAHNGYARTIRPLHTTADGDSIYGMSVGQVQADLDVVGTIGVQVMAEAVNRAVLSVESMYGLKCAKDFL